MLRFPFEKLEGINLHECKPLQVALVSFIRGVFRI